MKRVTGIGGIFFKASNVADLKAWYEQHLGIQYGDKEGGAMFRWREDDNPERRGYTVWSIFPKDTKYFGPGPASFMVNFRVADLDGLLRQLEKEGVELAGGIEEYDYGRFAWIKDPEGNRIELWEPPKK